MIPHKETHKPQKGSTRTCIVMFLLVTLLLCVVILTMYITLDQRLVDVENQLKAHDKQLKACLLLRQQFGQDDTSSGAMSFKGSNMKHSEEKDVLKSPKRVSRSSDNVSPNILSSIRSEVRQHLLKVTAANFCLPPNKVCLPGEKGVKGDSGQKGQTGGTKPGDPGAKGSKGDSGQKGQTGGGRQGPPGRTGSIGPPGKYGKQGPPGLKGVKGDSGNPGLRGFPGPKGERAEQISEPSVLVSPSTLTVTQKQTASFHCNAQGNPKPKVIWKRHSRQFDLGKTRIEASGLLQISNADANDTGNYTCTAKSILGEDTTTVQLLVKFPPRFRVIPTPFQTVLQGTTLHLTCAASGYPQPTVTWSRTFGSLPSDRAKQVEGILTITDFQLSDGVTYQCRAVNILGEITTHSTFHLRTKKFKAHFTNLGATGRFGPTSIGNHYRGRDHERQVTLSSGIQIWTVPYTSKYRIEAVGASGGYDKKSNSRSNRGRGARLIGTFALNRGDRIKILVGQEGAVNLKHRTSGGGGGSFVVTYDNNPLIIAGGGAGMRAAKQHHARSDGSITTSGNPGHGGSEWAGGRDGNGATIADTSFSGGGGGGFYTSGRLSVWFGGSLGQGGESGKGFLQGGVGGRAIFDGLDGGFGGGGGAYGGSEDAAGGGGGYSGGASGDNNLDSTGGGGGSYNSGYNQKYICCFNDQGHGYVVITEV